MARPDRFVPTPKDKFTFGLWTVGNIGRDPFGGPTRPALSPAEVVDLLGEVGGVYGVNFHDNDLIPIDASEAQAGRIKQEFQAALKRTGLKVPMATTNLFSDPVFKDGAFTSNDRAVRAYAIHKTMKAMELGAEFGAKVYVFWGGREGTDTLASKDPVQAALWFRQAMDFLCEYNLDRKFGYKFALEAKPNEPRGNLFFPVSGSYLGFIAGLKHPEMVGLNPEFAHETMAGISFVQVVGEALAAKKLFHIDLNDQEPGRFDQDLRFGSVNYKQAFFLAKLLIDYGYSGPKHFDSHAYRSSDRADVIEFARGSMRSWKILEDKVAQFNADKEIQSLLARIVREDAALARISGKFTKGNAQALLNYSFDRQAMTDRPLPYEKLDQLVFDLIMGVR